MTAVLSPTAVALRPPVARPTARGRVRTSLARHGEALGLFAVLWAVYIAVAAVIVFRYDAQPADALSRLDDGASVIFSSSPHLAAVGFVWNPLPSLTEIPLLLLKGIWPALLARGLAAGVTSALFMAAAVVGVRGILADRGAGRLARLGLPMLVAGMPYLLVYGGNGMSEAFFVCFLVWTTRSLLRFVDGGRSGDLVSAGSYLGFAYLSRYEAAAAALGVAALLVVVVVGDPRRATPARRRRLLVDLLLGIGPFGLTFVGWALASAVIVGSPFPQFSSAYGNSTQIGVDRADVRATTGQGSTRAVSYTGHQLFALMPLALLVVLAAVLLAWRWRSWRPLVPAAVFGAVLGFELLAFLAGDTFGWLRFFIMVIPLTACTLAAVVPVGRFGLRGAAAGLAVLAVLGSAYVSQWHVMGSATLAREEYVDVHQPLQGDRRLIEQSADLQQVASALDRLGAGRGQVLTEASDTVGVRTRTARQDIFLDTTDPHFARDLADPVRFGIRFLLVVAPGQGVDHLDASYPSLWSGGDGFGPRIASFPHTVQRYRIYRVTARVSPPPSEPAG